MFCGPFLEDDATHSELASTTPARQYFKGIEGHKTDQNAKLELGIDGWTVVSTHKAGCYETTLAHVEAFTMTPVDEENPTGQVKFALLEIPTYCIHIEWSEGIPNWWMHKIRGTMMFTLHQCQYG